MTSKSAPKHTNNKLRCYHIMKSYHEEEKLPIMKNMAKDDFQYRFINMVWNYEPITVKVQYILCDSKVTCTGQLELDMDACGLCCVTTLIAGFTFVFTSLTSVNACNLQHFTTVTLAIRCHPRHHWGRHSRYTTPQGHIVTFSCILVLNCRYGWRH